MIELLVVIAIIAILAAILFPVFAQAKRAAQKTADLSNFSQIGKSIMLYAQDHDDHSMCTDHDHGLHWFDSLYGYVKSRDVFKTPAYQRKAVLNDDNVLELPESDYSINGLFSHGESLSINSAPAEQIIIALRNVEVAEPDYHPWPDSAEDDPNTPDWDDLAQYIGPGHDGGPEEDWFRERLALKPWGNGSNFGFVDGHTKFLPWDRSVSGRLPGYHNIDRLTEEVH